MRYYFKQQTNKMGCNHSNTRFNITISIFSHIITTVKYFQWFFYIATDKKIYLMSKQHFSLNKILFFSISLSMSIEFKKKLILDSIQMSQFSFQFLILHFDSICFNKLTNSKCFSYYKNIRSRTFYIIFFCL